MGGNGDGDGDGGGGEAFSRGGWPMRLHGSMSRMPRTAPESADRRDIDRMRRGDLGAPEEADECDSAMQYRMRRDDTAPTTTFQESPTIQRRRGDGQHLQPLRVKQTLSSSSEQTCPTVDRAAPAAQFRVLGGLLINKRSSPAAIPTSRKPACPHAPTRRITATIIFCNCAKWRKLTIVRTARFRKDYKVERAWSEIHKDATQRASSLRSRLCAAIEGEANAASPHLPHLPQSDVT